MQRGKTYKQRPTSVRTTRKAQTQTGGATLPRVVEDPDGLFRGFQDHLKSSHRALEQELRPWLELCFRSDNAIAPLGNDEKHSTILKAYYVGLANIYKIFDVAIEFLRVTFNAVDTPIWKLFDTLEAKNASAKSFITALSKFLLFTSTDEQKQYTEKAKALADTLKTKPKTDPAYEDLSAEVIRNPVDAFVDNKSKVEKLIDKGLPYLLMYPDRLTNIFINVVAEMFVMFKRDAKTSQPGKSLLDELSPLFPGGKQTSKRAFAVEFYARKYEKRVGGKINNEDLNGCNGFFLDEDPTEFTNIIQNKFWDQLLDYSTQLYNIQNIPTVDFHSAKTTWANISAYVLRWYMDYDGPVENYLSSLFTFIKTHYDKQQTKVTIADNESRRVTMPPEHPVIGGKPVDKSAFTIPVYGITLDEVIAIMDTTTLEFVLNLARTLLYVEAATEEPPTTQGTAGSTAKTSLPRTPESLPVRLPLAGAPPV